jgi:hypothetical protein
LRDELFRLSMRSGREGGRFQRSLFFQMVKRMLAVTLQRFSLYIKDLVNASFTFVLLF